MGTALPPRITTVRQANDLARLAQQCRAPLAAAAYRQVSDQIRAGQVPDLAILTRGADQPDGQAPAPGMPSRRTGLDVRA